MKTTHKTLIAMLTVATASSLAVIPSAQAAHPNDSAYPPAQKSNAPGKTRAEVKAELKQAYEQGRLPVIDSNYPVLKDAKQPKTREQVKKEMEQSKRSGESGRLMQELYSG
ncbi:DUF4148 domain-containing protein [Herminiimonas sp. KBW02]|uniref:DUF4148 domain-containing protein n=1 Tax=Herminiimonas sp. KBW02 TaxID=2153363 RepID=UPI000F58FD81|nr:DUF4148 domain-containing protein [Herminiimonas sp. KBW02]RQO33504.1 DUF4148 domain-containing protein [Herminiimonas sp. KBW02]